jgi:hypothetical protein
MNLNIKSSHWFMLVGSALLGAFLWILLALPRYQMIDLSINRHQAEDIAMAYINQKLGIDAKDYKRAIVFSVDEASDCYLQKTLGTSKAKEFIDKFKYDLFFWNIRFFKEKQKEELRVMVSSKTGEVINFSHAIEETAKRPFVDLDAARGHAIDFITRYYGYSPDQYVLHTEHTEKKENRTDYLFSWEIKNVEIPWDIRYGGGKAKLLISVYVSGNEIFSFNKNQLTIPEAFNRYMEGLKQTGDNLMLGSSLLYLGLLTIAIMLLVNRKKFVIPQIVKPFYLCVGAFLFIGIILDVFNGYQRLIYYYSTSQSFLEYVLKDFISTCVGVFFMVLAFVLPGLTGETLRYEVNPQEKARGLLSPILSSFCSKPIALQIWVGYLVACAILGLQAVIFRVGYNYFGVWDELSWLTQSSTAIIPALGAFVFALHSSVAEETMFRLFAINLFKRYGLGASLAVFLSALMWGFGHTGYPVFPMWFRGIEVMLLGIAFGFVYLRFGFVTVLVAHFLIDAFRDSLQHLINFKISFDFISCLGVLILPLIFSLIAWALNRSTVERSWQPKFTPQQEFNYQLLKKICSLKTTEELAVFKNELSLHGWDPVIVERVFQEFS